DPVAIKVLRWMDLIHAQPAGRFAEIAAFLAQNPDWPGQKALRRQAEAALSGQPDTTAAAWLARHPPLSAAGLVRQAEILLDRGNAAAGAAALRAAWIDGDFAAADEKDFLARHGAAIRPQDDTARLDRLLWDGESEAARRMLPRLSTGARALAETRLALTAIKPDAPALYAHIPAPLRADPGLLFDEARWDRKQKDIDAAARILLAATGDPSHPILWWSERQLVARRLMAGGKPDLAYKIVARHGRLAGEAYAEAEFLLGFIALHFMKEPALAFEHFSRMLSRADTSFMKARAGYWGGRAAEAEGKSALAEKWFAVGAEHMATFYGQLAAHQLGRDAPPHPRPEPVPDAAARARFDGNELVRATRLFFAAGYPEFGRAFLLHLAKRVRSAADFGMLAGLAEQEGRLDLGIAVAQLAVRAGMPLMMHGYPEIILPGGGDTEHALLLAIMRQESEFELQATSPVGARGLMQLMPATAKLVAREINLPFSSARLVADGIYNISLGRAYLQSLIDDFGGSYALAIAAYNAGPGRVLQWLKEYGDPRGGQIGMVDWIELIPVGETRNYVQRVLENLQIYRGQAGHRSAFSLVSDLAR
ncbi:MAG TPA: lytic transglycosylase domain-containing protein, partial [Stellaceae bacterium]|nr:lytic transglycosylase domain-containing protein [Stellaceae bacterium]